MTRVVDYVVAAVDAARLTTGQRVHHVDVARDVYEELQGLTSLEQFRRHVAVPGTDGLTIKTQLNPRLAPGYIVPMMAAYHYNGQTYGR